MTQERLTNTTRRYPNDTEFLAKAFSSTSGSRDYRAGTRALVAVAFSVVPLSPIANKRIPCIDVSILDLMGWLGWS